MRARVKRILITGMSGTGKSTLIEHLDARGYRAVDVDQPDWSQYAPDGEWVWRENRIRSLLSQHEDGVLFLSGCASNQVKFYRDFDEIVLLSAPETIMRERLATRTTNSFGKHPDELAHIMDNLRNVEPLLRRVATLEIDTSAPLAEVTDTLLESLCLPLSDRR